MKILFKLFYCFFSNEISFTLYFQFVALTFVPHGNNMLYDFFFDRNIL